MSEQLAGEASMHGSRFLERFDSWSRWRLEGLEPSQDRQVIAAYVRWHLRPRLVTLVERRRLNDVHLAHARQQVNAAIGYLASLAGRQQHLGELTQGDVDTLFAERASHAVSVRNFLSFAVSSKLCGPLRVPSYRSGTRELMTEERRSELISRLVGDESLALADRVAGLLVLVLAQPAARIVTLRSDAISTSGDEVTIRLAKTPAPLPEPMSALVTALAELRSANGQAPDLLFPGRRPGEALGQRALTQRLRQIGVTCTGRRASLHTLARELPAPVLIDVLGYSRNFVAQLLDELRVDWNTYAALKARQRRAS